MNFNMSIKINATYRVFTLRYKKIAFLNFVLEVLFFVWVFLFSSNVFSFKTY